MQVVQIPNPFGELLQSFNQVFAPMLMQYVLNYQKIKDWSDPNLSDEKQTLEDWNKNYLKGILNKDGTINMKKVQDYIKNGNDMQKALATQLQNVIENRQKLANAPLIGKIQALQNPDAEATYGLTINPQALQQNQQVYDTLSKQFANNPQMKAILDAFKKNGVSLSQALPLMLAFMNQGDNNNNKPQQTTSSGSSAQQQQMQNQNAVQELLKQMSNKDVFKYLNPLLDQGANLV